MTDHGDQEGMFDKLTIEASKIAFALRNNKLTLLLDIHLL